MAVTRLERKGRKNKNVAKGRVATMKRLNAKPSIKNVDIEAIKKEFSNKAKPAKKEAEAKTPAEEPKKVAAKEAPEAKKTVEKKAPAKEKSAAAKKKEEKPAEGK